MADANVTGNNAQDLTDDELGELANFGPSITDEQMEKLERLAADNVRGLQRRLCLVACARSADVLSNLSIESPDAFGEMLECIEAFKEHTKGLAEFAEAAYARMRIADCREGLAAN